MHRDEVMVAEFLTRSNRLKVETFNDDLRLGATETPDFKVSGPIGEFFFCEVKSIRPSSPRSPSEPLLHNTMFNRLTRVIHKAARQFRAVNSQHLVPNVLVWVSRVLGINERTLIELLQGSMSLDNHVFFDASRQLDGRIKESGDLNTIDLHIFLQAIDTPAFLFTPRWPEHLVTLQQAFAPTLPMARIPVEIPRRFGRSSFRTQGDPQTIE